MNTRFSTARLPEQARVVSQAALLSLAIAGLACAQNLNYVQTNLVSDRPGTATNTDSNLRGAWGVSESPTSPFWVSNAASGTSTLYNTAGAPQTTVVTIPPAPNGRVKTGAPTGQVFNGTGGFLLDNGRPASFLFATLDGTISAWNGGAAATIKVDNNAKGASYTGLAIGISDRGPTLYAADAANGRVDAWDTNFRPIQFAGGFLDVALNSAYVPFNIQRLGRRLFVTYALPQPGSHFTAGPGTGAVNMFDLNGNIIQRLASEGHLNAPWGVAIAPGQFGTASHALLVGNFGDGKINVFDPFFGDFLGTLEDGKGNPIVIPGLWALVFGNGGNGGDPNTLYFAADIDGSHGLFGTLRPMADSIQP